MTTFVAEVEAMNTLREAILKLIDRLPATGGTVTPIADAKRPPGRPRKLTIDEVKVIAQKVKDEKTSPVYFHLLSKFGAKQIAELPESRYPEFMAAADVLLAEKQEPEPEEEPEL